MFFLVKQIFKKKQGKIFKNRPNFQKQAAAKFLKNRPKKPHMRKFAIFWKNLIKSYGRSAKNIVWIEYQRGPFGQQGSNPWGGGGVSLRNPPCIRNLNYFPKNVIQCLLVIFNLGWLQIINDDCIPLFLYIYDAKQHNWPESVQKYKISEQFFSYKYLR